ncbi:MAG: TonB-dependent receptor [Bacteroidota bacterium]
MKIHFTIIPTRAMRLFAAVPAIMLLLLPKPTQAQEQTGTQTIIGQLTDSESKFPIFGAQVAVIGTEPLLGAVSDESGNYRIKNVPLGRHTIKVSYIGYGERSIPNVLLTSGKEYVLNLGLQESVTRSDEVVITSGRNKGQAKNEMALVSARSFNVEETRRYAGSRNDPARMASNFAGVSGVNDGRNDIIIRGNSPSGLLWRMDGADIPNPSHFGAMGATGGPVSMLNNNVLDQSDFLTGAFPADYGNALSGVFDLSMRSGNPEKREYTGQIGFNGFEAGVEGPFSRKSRSSFMANYRYTTLGVFKQFGLNVGTGAAVPIYQDLNFKLNFMAGKYGKISLFGIMGKSHIEFKGADADSTNLYTDNRTNTDYATSMGIVGLNWMHFWNPNTFGKLVISASGNTVDSRVDSLAPFPDYPNKAIQTYGDKSQNTRISIRYIMNHKFSARSTLNAGLFADRLGFTYHDSVLNYTNNQPYFRKLRNDGGSTGLFQAYTQYQYKFSDKLSANAGLHAQILGINNSRALEPRAALQYAPDNVQSFSFGYGLHSQMQQLSTYYTRTRLSDGTYTLTNKDLGFSKAQHFVLGWNRSLGSAARLKVETYFQNLYNVPVEQRSSSVSVLNAGADFNTVSTDSLLNKGTGRNFGLEVTAERFFSRGYYWLLTASVFDSKYQGSDMVWRNTAFNGNYIVNALAGREIKIGDKNVLAFDTKICIAGGRRYTPLDLVSSAAQHQAKYYTDEAYSKQFKPYFRMDFKITYRRNGNKIMQEFFVDVQNIFNTQNIFTQGFNIYKNQPYYVYQLGLFPNVNYRINF